MKRVTLSAFVIISFLLYSLGIRNADPAPVSDDRDTGKSGSGTGSGAGSDMPAVSYKDGSYTGPVTDAFYGDIQVRAIIKGGRLTDVKFLKYPDDQPNSIAINKQAMPYLKREAIQAQSAQVDGVSGATIPRRRSSNRCRKPCGRPCSL
jgi:uncharacterized protein with FMN-binding domain